MEAGEQAGLRTLLLDRNMDSSSSLLVQYTFHKSVSGLIMEDYLYPLQATHRNGERERRPVISLRKLFDGHGRRLDCIELPNILCFPKVLKKVREFNS